MAFDQKLKKRLKLSSLKSNSSYKGSSRSSPRRSDDDDDTTPRNSSKTKFSYVKKKRVYATKAELTEHHNHVNEVPRTMWAASKTKQRSSSSFKTTNDAAKASRGMLKTKSPRGDDGKHDTPRKQTYRKRDDLEKNGDVSRSKSSDVRSYKAKKQAFADKKVLDDGLDSQEDQPRKRKRIRLDPYDTSNKRIDDDVVLDVSHKEKKKNDKEKKSVEMSQNAQFRAIQPSQSILSYVEENLLGRRRLTELKKAGYNTELPAPLDNIPQSTSTERERIEESLFRNKLEFFAAANVSSSFPPPDVPEIAFAGRSNVGKSSLLNALTRQWGVVRTSDKPGLTQTINFFDLGPKVRLVDLPGYGFAYAKDEVKEAWEDLVKEYVSTRSSLKRVCLLVDTKWGMKPSSSRASLSNYMAPGRQDWLQDDFHDEKYSQSSSNSGSYSNLNYISVDEHISLAPQPPPMNRTHNVTRFCPEESYHLHSGQASMYAASSSSNLRLASDNRVLTRNRSLVDVQGQLLHRSLVEEARKRRLIKTVGDVGFQSPYAVSRKPRSSRR